MKKVLKGILTVSLSAGVLFGSEAMIIPTVVNSAFAASQFDVGYQSEGYKTSANHSKGLNWNRYSTFSMGNTPVLSWSTPIGNGEQNEEAIHTFPAIDDDGTVYAVGTSAKKVVAVSSNGSIKWEMVLDGKPVGAPVIGKDGTIYVTTYDQDRVYALTTTGSVKWVYEGKGPIKGSVALSKDDKIYFASEDRKLYALSTEGKELWATSLDGKSVSTPIVAADGSVYVGTLNGALYAVNPDGSIQWIKQIPGPISYSAPTIDSNGSLIFGHQQYRVSSISKSGGLNWEVGSGANVEYSSPAVTPNGDVYIIGGTWLTAFDSKGNLKWKVTNPEVDLHNGVVVDKDGTIYATSMEGRLLAFDSNTGKEKWQIGLSRYQLSAPVLSSDGTIYVQDTTGKLFAVDTFGKKKGEDQSGIEIYDLNAFATQRQVQLSWKVNGDPDYIKVTTIRFNHVENSAQTKGESFTVGNLRPYTTYTFEIVAYKNGQAGTPIYTTVTTIDPEEAQKTPDIVYADYVDSTHKVLLVKIKSITKENYVVVKDSTFKTVQRIPVKDGSAHVVFEEEGVYDIHAEAVNEETGNSYFSQPVRLTVEFRKSEQGNDITNESFTAGVATKKGSIYTVEGVLPAPEPSEKVFFAFYNEEGKKYTVYPAKKTTQGKMSISIKRNVRYFPLGEYTLKATYKQGSKVVKELETKVSFQ